MVTSFSSPSELANFVKSLTFRAQMLQGSGVGTASNTVASAMLGARSNLKSFRARVVDGGTVGAGRNVCSLIKLPSGVATESTLLTLATTQGSDGELYGSLEGTTAQMSPGDVLVLKTTLVNGATIAYLTAETDERFGA